MTQAQLEARKSLAGEWFREGRITRPECLRLEVDAFLGEDSGPVKWIPNMEFVELSEDGVFDRRPA